MVAPNKDKQFHYAYEITNVNNGMKYIGSRSCACLPCMDTKYMSSSKTLKKAIEEAENAHFVKIVLQEFPTRKEALEHEVLLHNKFDVGRNPDFYNKAKQTSVGFWCDATGRKLSKETKQKQRIARLKNPMSAEARKKRSKTLLEKNKGKRSPRYGTHASEETKKKQREERLRNPISPEEYKRRADKRRGKYKGENSPRYKKVTDKKHRKTISESLSGEKSPQFGKPIPPEIKEKMSISSSNRILCIYVTPAGEFTSAKEAGKALDCYSKTVRYRCEHLFEGYSLKLLPNKKEEFKKLYKQGVKLSEISKTLEVKIEVLRNWKRKFYPEDTKRIAK